MCFNGSGLLFEDSLRPEVALITNHGYASPQVKIGGVPDTGGQVVYVNVLALKLEQLGYKVSIYSRGGFPKYKGYQIRKGVSYLSEFVRYEYLCGGGDKFLPKENISPALNQELHHLYKIVQDKAKAKGCQEWEVFEFINSHYWDAGVIGMSLIDFWQNDFVYELVEKYFADYLSTKDKDKLFRNRHWQDISKLPVFHIVKILFKKFKGSSVQRKALQIIDIWESVFHEKLFINKQILAAIFKELPNTQDESYKELDFITLLAKKIFERCQKFKGELKTNFSKINKHIWTPHSLGEIKNYNMRGAPASDRSSLRLRERDSHEINICARTPFFISTSTEITDCLISYYRVDEKSIFYLHPQADKSIFRKYSPEELSLAYEYLAEVTDIKPDLLKKSKIIFETSRMDLTKRKDLIIEAFANICDDYQDVYLLIGGGSKNKVYNELEKQINAKPGLEKKVFLLDYIPQKFIGPVFYIADIYVSASEMEGFGMSVAQASATKSQIISSDLIPFSTNFAADCIDIFPNGDGQELARLMKKTLDTPNMENVKKLTKISEKISWQVTIKNLIEFLRKKGLDIKNGVGSERGQVIDKRFSYRVCQKDLCKD